MGFLGINCGLVEETWWILARMLSKMEIGEHLVEEEMKMEKKLNWFESLNYCETDGLEKNFVSFLGVSTTVFLKSWQYFYFQVFSPKNKLPSEYVPKYPQKLDKHPSFLRNATSPEGFPVQSFSDTSINDIKILRTCICGWITLSHSPFYDNVHERQS